MTLDAGRVLKVLESVMEAQSLHMATCAATRELSDATGAVATGLLIVLHDSIFLESWHPDDEDSRIELNTHFSELAIETAQRGAPVVAPGFEFSGMKLVPQLRLLPLTQRLTGVLCSAFPAAPPEAGDGTMLVDRIGGLIARRLVALLDLEAERRKSVQYQRWAQFSDKQIKSLDLERQKFAALANSFKTSLFVADRTRIVRWSNRQLLERFEASGATGSCVGQPCERLCRLMGEADVTACGGCILNRVLENGLALREVVATRPDRGEAVQVTAVPIKDLKGHVQEVMVALQGIAQFSQARKAA